MCDLCKCFIERDKRECNVFMQDVDPVLGFPEKEKSEEFVVSCFAYIKQHVTAVVYVITLFCVNSPVLSSTVNCRDEVNANLNLTSSFKSGVRNPCTVLQQKV